jgi:putative ubiquitin-RnfH superfamily antitoxin RatB of RatAB toxin-antitoxin module
MSGDAEPPLIEVLIVCALRERQVLRTVRIEAPCTINDAVQHSGVLDEFPELDQKALSFAVFGSTAANSQGLQNGDRVEILRALQVDPREARRRRARLKQSTAKD